MFGCPILPVLKGGAFGLFIDPLHRLKREERGQKPRPSKNEGQGTRNSNAKPKPPVRNSDCGMLRGLCHLLRYNIRKSSEFSATKSGGRVPSVLSRIAGRSCRSCMFSQATQDHRFLLTCARSILFLIRVIKLPLPIPCQALNRNRSSRLPAL